MFKKPFPYYPLLFAVFPMLFLYVNNLGEVDFSQVVQFSLISVRQDVLQSIYGYDNIPFLTALRERKFYIADSAHSNDGVTGLSMVSTST